MNRNRSHEAINPPSAWSRTDGRLLAAMDTEGPKPVTSYTLVLVDGGSDPRPIGCRLKQLLKWALRIFGLRCIEAHASDGSAVSQ